MGDLLLLRCQRQTFTFVGTGGGQVVSVLAFYFDDPNLNPAVKFVLEKNKN